MITEQDPTRINQNHLPKETKYFNVIRSKTQHDEEEHSEDEDAGPPEADKN